MALKLLKYTKSRAIRIQCQLSIISNLFRSNIVSDTKTKCMKSEMFEKKIALFLIDPVHVLTELINTLNNKFLI